MQSPSTFLAEWYDFQDVYLWPDEKLNELVRRAPHLMAKHGTVGGMKEYLSLYTGTVPEIREDDKNPNLVTIAVPERYITNMREYSLLLRIIGHMLPAGMDVRVTSLRDQGEIRKAISIGVNSFLGGTEDDTYNSTRYPGIILENNGEAEK